jgi:hypothetical protein
LHKELKGFAEEYDAIINFAGDSDNTSIKSPKIFEAYERMQKAEMMSTLMTCHLASNYLSANGYLVFTSSVDALKKKETDKK